MDFEESRLEEIRKLKEQKIKFFKQFHQCVIQYVLPELREIEKSLINRGYKTELSPDVVLNFDAEENLIKKVILNYTSGRSQGHSIKVLRLPPDNDNGKVIFELEQGKENSRVRSFAIENINKEVAKEVLDSYLEEILREEKTEEIR